MQNKIISWFLAVAITVTQQGNIILVSKFAGAFLAISYLTNSTDGWADAISDKGVEGQTFARDLLRQYDQPAANQSTGVITLYPDSQPSTVNVNELFPDMVPGALNGADAAYGNDAALNIEASSGVANLSIGIDTQSRAYQTLFNSITGRPHPNMTTDPVFAKSDNILSGLDPTFLANFQDCTVNESLNNTQEVVHVPDIKTCKRVTSNSECKLFHNMEVHNSTAARNINGVITIDNVGTAGGFWATPGAPIDRTRPTIAYNLRTGSVWITESHKAQRLLGRSISPLITDAEYQAVCGGGQQYSVQLIALSVTNSTPSFPPATITPTSIPSCANNFTGTFHYGDWGNTTWAWFRAETISFTTRFDASTTILDLDEWVPSDPNCLTSYQNTLNDGFCTPTYSCTAPPDASGCTVISGINVCPTNPVYNTISKPPAPLTGIDQLCKEVTVQAACTFNVGPLDCYIDINGVEQCPSNDGSEPNGCLIYENDPACGFIEASCVEGTQGASGQCYAFNEIWDCGFDVNIDNVVVSKAVDCSGPIRCMGTDCSAPIEESSQDFARAVAATKAVSMMKMDQDCVNEFNCEIFKGEAYECKEAVGGLVDCCEEPTGGPGLTDYMQLLSSVGQIDSAVNSMESLEILGADVKGAWDALSAPVDQVLSTATDTFTSAMETITGSTSVAETAASVGFKQTLINEAAQWTTSVFGEQAASTLFTEVAAGTYQLGGASAWLGNLVGWAFTLYTIYQIVVLVINLLWTCEQREFELGSKKKLKTCHYVGSYCADDILGFCIESRDSYCCFNSPLSRIFQEQARPILGLNFGTPKAPICTGLTAAQLSSADLSGVDLSEYIGILQITGQMPDLSNYESTFSLDALTGSGNPLNVDGSRTDAGTRTLNRMGQMGNDPDAIREQIRGDLY